MNELPSLGDERKIVFFIYRHQGSAEILILLRYHGDRDSGRMNRLPTLNPISNPEKRELQSLYGFLTIDQQEAW